MKSQRRRQRRGLGALLFVAAASVALNTMAFLGMQPQQQQPQQAQQPAGARESDAAEGIARRCLLAALAGGVTGATGLLEEAPKEAYADGGTARFAFPPIDRKDKFRCKFVSSAMGQANAQRDKLLDLRECQMAYGSAADMDIAGAIMNDGNFTGVSFENTVMSKTVAMNASLENATFRNAVADRINFKGASLKNTIFQNAVLTGSNFDGADLTNSDFTDAFIDMSGIRPLCRNPTMKGTNPVTGADTYESAGCFNQGFAR